MKKELRQLMKALRRAIAKNDSAAALELIVRLETLLGPQMQAEEEDPPAGPP